MNIVIVLLVHTTHYTQHNTTQKTSSFYQNSLSLSDMLILSVSSSVRDSTSTWCADVAQECLNGENAQRPQNDPVLGAPTRLGLRPKLMRTRNMYRDKPTNNRNVLARVEWRVFRVVLCCAVWIRFRFVYRIMPHTHERGPAKKTHILFSVSILSIFLSSFWHSRLTQR